MKSIVTGGAGFVGSHICDLLLEKGHEIICIDNLVTGTTRNIEHIRSEHFTYIEHDITKPIYFGDKIEYIFHLASPASPIDYLDLPIQTLKVGALGTYNMLGLAKEKGARLLLASTSEVYGDPLVNPQPETYWGNVNPIGPRGVYDEAKRYAEAITMAYHRYHGVDTCIARIFNTYGPRMRADDGRVVPNFINQALKGKDMTVYGDGTQTRSFCYVSNLVDGLYRLMMSTEVGPVNLGNPKEISVLDFARIVIKIIGCDSKIVFEELPLDDPKVRRPNIERANDLLKWQPDIPLENGLIKTIEYFENIT
ncbi:MAG: NAD-dependent epimerase/dehydratase family protein [ANME-2 cluster archaeon HR1]|jgi:dTDP-glucose 4,6-dehydratase|nr:MAG: dTDP-glucose 4,6-dehydratase [ANME-2 cluster archaeon]KAF5424950.1 dTDP-glucose 4,6-dehydratase [ANME-2 cluster archaeon]PPA79025.1 MAG: NAD-dependent epimerase/dehydratase family protein [ANME-2 cluster archaeon HR1]